MPRKLLELPPEIAREFVRDMRAFFATKGIAADRFAARQLHALKEHYDGKLKLHDVQEMFVQMRDSDVDQSFSGTRRNPRGAR